MQHPKDLFKSVEGKDIMEEWDVALPRCLPVPLQLWDMYQSHVDDNSQD